MQHNNAFYKQLRELYPNGHPNFISLALEEIKLHSDKNADYAKGGDPLGNFNRAAQFLQDWGYDLAPSDVAFIYMMKQIDAAGNMLGQCYEGQVEGLDARLQDISVYAKLVRILLEEEKQGAEGK